MTTTENQAQTVEQALMARKDFLRTVLPRHLTPERLVKVVLLARSRSPLLGKCTTESLLKAVMASAEMGLEPSGAVGGAHLVPFRNGKTGNYECQLVPDYRGLLDLARRSGEIQSVEAHVIHANETYRVRYGLDSVLEHEPLLDGSDPGPMVAVYAVAKLKGGGSQFVVLTRAEVDATRARSRAKNDGPWTTDYEAMSLKTAVRRLCNYLPRSRELAQAIAADEDDTAIDIELSPAEATRETSKLSTPTERLRAKVLPETSRPRINIIDIPSGMDEADMVPSIPAVEAAVEASPVGGAS